MSTTLIRRVIDAFIALFCIGGILLFARAAAAILDGRFGTVTWPVQASAYDLEVELGGQASVIFDDGSLALSGQPLLHATDLVFSMANIGILIAALFYLRKVLVRFAEGDLLNTQNAAALRTIGQFLLLGCALSVTQALILQTGILSAITPNEGTVLHPSISWDVKGMQNIWLHYSPPFVTFTLGGLALLCSQALQVGMAYRDDSESVI